MSNEGLIIPWGTGGRLCLNYGTWSRSERVVSFKSSVCFVLGQRCCGWRIARRWTHRWGWGVWSDFCLFHVHFFTLSILLFVYLGKFLYLYFIIAFIYICYSPTEIPGVLTTVIIAFFLPTTSSIGTLVCFCLLLWVFYYAVADANRKSAEAEATCAEAEHKGQIEAQGMFVGFSVSVMKLSRPWSSTRTSSKCFFFRFVVLDAKKGVGVLCRETGFLCARSI